MLRDEAAEDAADALAEDDAGYDALDDDEINELRAAQRGGESFFDMMLRVEAFSEPVEGEAAYRYTWWPEKEYDFFDKNPRYVREGMMEAFLCGHQLRRSRAYLCGSPTKSQIRQVDEHELVFESHYLEWDILEHIRLVDMDRFRSRSIYSWCNGALALAEVHHESRVEES